MKIERKEVAWSKITISPGEIRIKIPLAYQDDEAAEIIAFAQRVVSKVGPVETTLRGSIKKGQGEFSVTLRRNNKDVAGRFKSEDV